VQLDWSIKVSDVLTAATIIISVTALLASWSKDRYSRQKIEADKVRGAVAVAIAKLDRWLTLQLSGFQELQPVFIEASEMLAKNRDVVAVRDFLWKSIDAQRAKILSEILGEQIESAYVGLFSHFPAVRPLYLETLSRLREAEEDSMSGFLKSTQSKVLSFERHMNDYTSAMLGNELRATAIRCRKEFEGKVSEITKPARGFLLEVIAKPDQEILTQGLRSGDRDGASAPLHPAPIPVDPNSAPPSRGGGDWDS